MGFEWTVREYAAKKTFAQRVLDLQAYKEKHGHVNVKKSDDKSFMGFVATRDTHVTIQRNLTWS